MKPRRRRRNWLPVAAPAIAVAILAAGVLIERLPAKRSGTPLPEAPVSASDVEDSFASLFLGGIEQLRAGRAHEAAKVFEVARQQRPHLPEVYVNLGYAYLAMGTAEAAGSAFETALELRPTQVNAYFGLAESHEARGDLAAALGAMRSYVHLTPADDPFRRRALAAIWEWEAAGAEGWRTETAVFALPNTESDTPDERGGAATLAEAELTRLDGAAEPFARHLGKAVVLNVWATWCPPCRVELPSLQRLSQRLDPDRYAVIGLSIDEDADYVREFLRDSGVDYQNYIDPGQQISSGLLAVETFPQTLLISPDGTLRERVAGAQAWDSPESLARIEALP